MEQVLSVIQSQTGNAHLLEPGAPSHQSPGNHQLHHPSSGSRANLSLPGTAHCPTVMLPGITVWVEASLPFALSPPTSCLWDESQALRLRVAPRTFGADSNSRPCPGKAALQWPQGSFPPLCSGTMGTVSRRCRFNPNQDFS